MLVCYISGHGFGHAVRVVEVLRALWRLRSDLPVTLRTSVPRWFFDDALPGPFTYAACRLDIGAVQRDSLSLDEAATLTAYAEIDAQRDELVAAEIETLTALRPAVVFADIPALAFDVAGQLGAASVAMTNFSWDWIYADYVRDFPSYSYLVAALRSSYSKAERLLRLPFHGDLSAFPIVSDIPLVARHATLSRQSVRQRLGLPADKRLVLLSFGGIGLALAQAPVLPGIAYIATQSAAPSSTPPNGCSFISNAALAAAGVRYEDLVTASDAVISKPGYGIVSDCIANGARLIYTTRGRFAEYPHLVQGIKENLPNAFISNDDLYCGRWSEALDEVFAQAPRSAAIATNGADVAAAHLLSVIGSL